MATLIVLSGLPASGKSTRAKVLLKEYGPAVRVNKDLLRTMLHFDKFTGKNEDLTNKIEYAIAGAILASGMNVVVDDTNLNPKVFFRWKELAETDGHKFKHIPMETSVEECLQRDPRREKTVGKEVIKGMAMQYGMMPAPKKGYIICDIDGTIADISHRREHVLGEKKDWKSFFEHMMGDKVVASTMDLLVQYKSEGWDIVFVSGRPEDYRKQTEFWLASQCAEILPYFALFMRRAGDKRPDTEVKQQILDTYFKDKSLIHKVIDDRPCVIRMWRENGLDVIDVGDGVEF